MNALRTLMRRIIRLFSRRKIEHELDEEMAFHLEQSIERNLERGMSPDQARREALMAFGGVEQSKETCRDAWGTRLVQELIRDSIYALRSLRRSPGFTFIAVLTLGLGIGVNAVMFSFVRDTVLRPLVRDSQLNLTSIYNGREGADRNFRHFSYAEYAILRESNDLFEDVAASYFGIRAVGRKGDLQRRFVGVASENYFELIGIQPLQGRFFNAAESQPAASIPVVVANYGLWERLGRPADFVGSTIRVKQRDYTVIGITPKGFVGLHASIGPDVWLPLGEANQFSDRRLHTAGFQPFSVVARLAPDLTMETAKIRLPAVNQRINAQALPEDNGPRQLVLAAPSRMNLGNSSPSNEGFLNLFAMLSMGLASTVLIVACLNLANMVLARGAARQREIAIRLSLGASRWRVIRQLTTEGLMLSMFGGAVGLMLSFWANSALQRLSSETFAAGNFALSVYSFIDIPIICATFGFCLVATLASSLGPALRATRPNLVDDLKQQGGEVASTSRWRRFFSLGNGLVIAQIALSLTLLFSASLFVRSSWKARTMDLGYQTKDQIVANLDYRMTELEPDAIGRRQTALLDHMTAINGAGRAALASNIPYNFELSGREVFPASSSSTDSATDKTQPRVRAGHTAVSQDYFSLLDITVLKGRTFTFAESTSTESPKVAIIDERVAKLLFGEKEAIGQRVFISSKHAATGDLTKTLEVVGVVRSHRDSVFSDPPPRIYRPLGQVHAPNIYLHVGVSQTRQSMDTLRQELRTFDPVTPVLFVRPLASFVEKNINMLLIELAGTVFGLFGGIALFLAIVGVYGVKSHAVAKRTREIGIRMALGARPQQVMALILRQGAQQTAVGLLIGIGVSLAAGKVLAGMIYQASGSDGPVLVGSAFILAFAVLFACWIPARRATKVDPATTLRSE